MKILSSSQTHEMIARFEVKIILKMGTVRGSTGKEYFCRIAFDGYYEGLIDRSPSTPYPHYFCECHHFTYRLSKTINPCKHIKLLLEKQTMENKQIRAKCDKCGNVETYPLLDWIKAPCNQCGHEVLHPFYRHDKGGPSHHGHPTKVIGFRVTEGDIEALDAACKALSTTRSKIIRAAVMDYIGGAA